MGGKGSRSVHALLCVEHSSPLSRYVLVSKSRVSDFFKNLLTAVVMIAIITAADIGALERVAVRGVPRCASPGGILEHAFGFSRERFAWIAIVPFRLPMNSAV